MKSLFISNDLIVKRQFHIYSFLKVNYAYLDSISRFSGLNIKLNLSFPSFMVSVNGAIKKLKLTRNSFLQTKPTFVEKKVIDESKVRLA
jgi:hypothetical protein